jgi:tRNA pseudouridine38-40 synthase
MHPMESGNSRGSSAHGERGSAARFKLLIAYDGTDFLGWQSQPGGKTVQDAIETALCKIFKNEIRLHGASRTDSGVHASGQVAHFDAPWPHALGKLKDAINSLLPETIRILSISKTKENFHARFSAQGKRYVYQLKTAPATPFESRYVCGLRCAIDLKKLKAALKLFVGKHDFTSFAGGVKEGEMAVKTIKRITLARKGAYLAITIVGSGFLYKMVRSLVGTALEVARGKLPLSRIREILKSKKRTHEVITAPAKGLRLEKVFYPGA